MKEKKFTKWFYWFTLGMAIIVVYKLLDNFGQITGWFGNLFNVLTPFIMGLLIAYLFYIPCRKVESWYRKVKKPKIIAKRARGLSIITVYIIAILLIIIALNFVIPNIAKSIVDFVNNFGGYYNDTMETINNLPEESVWKNDVIIHLAESIQNIDLKQYLNMEMLTEYAKGAINVVTSIFDIFVSFIVSIYLLAERKQILNFFRKLTKAIVKEDTYQMISKYFNKSNEVFFFFF